MKASRSLSTPRYDFQERHLMCPFLITSTSYLGHPRQQILCPSNDASHKPPSYKAEIKAWGEIIPSRRKAQKT